MRPRARRQIAKVTWVRLGLLALVLGVVAVALTQTAAAPAPVAPEVAAPEPRPTEPPDPPPAPEPTPRPTRIPLPTAPPQMIISRLARETPLPRPTATPSTQPRVGIVDSAYLPAELTVGAGARVTWTNTGSEGHDVVGGGPGGSWGSSTLAPMESYARQFVLPGTFEYRCSVHPEMRGRIVVQP